jgi:hypothetical protein
MITLFKRMDNYDDHHRALDGRVTKVEISTASGAWVERVVFILITAIISGSIYFGK